MLLRSLRAIEENFQISGEDYGLTPEIIQELQKKKVDIARSLEIIIAANANSYNYPGLQAESLPSVDGKDIFNPKAGLTVNAKQVHTFAQRFGFDVSPLGVATPNGISFDANALTVIGEKLLPKVAFGVLNGGSASSYVDGIKNNESAPDLIALHSEQFEALKTAADGKPKAMTPAYLNPNGTPGADFFALKIRGVLINTLKAQLAGNNASLPIFEMTSYGNHDMLLNAIQEYATTELLAELISETKYPINSIADYSKPQALLSAMTQGNPKEGLPFKFFTEAKGSSPVIDMPGGHGDGFRVLKSIYTALRDAGMKYAYLGNIDNLGATIDPIEVAILAITGKKAGFDTVYRTQADVKGGIIIREPNGNINCGDIGVAVSKDDFKKYCAEGKDILFNCATGLFDLDWLVDNIDNIITNLPMRLSNQNKEKGKYAQAEQVTWEVIGMLANEDKAIFAGPKDERFLAAKMAYELFLASSFVPASSENYPAQWKDLAIYLQNGMNNILAGAYGMTLENGQWRPLSVAELKAKFEKEAEQRAKTVSDRSNSEVI